MVNIETLSGRVEIDDKMTAVLSLLSNRVQTFSDNFDKSMRNADASMTRAATVGSALGNIIGNLTLRVIDFAQHGLVQLGEKGSKIIGVRDAFNQLSEAAGELGSVLLGKLEEGTKGTVDSMDLMQTANRALSAGLKVTGADMQSLGATARAMGKAAGTDAASELRTLFDALTTGRTRTLSLKGVVVDLDAAEKALAKTLNIQAKDLDHASKLQAARNAILTAAKNKVDQLGESQLTFAEKFQKARIAVGNWWDELSVAIAQSSNVNRAIDSIGDALKRAFGVTSRQLLDKVVEWINMFADAAAYWGPKIIEWLKATWQWISNIWEKIQETWDDIPDWFKKLAGDAALAGVSVWALNEGFNAITGGDRLGPLSNVATTISGIRDASALASKPVLGLAAAFKDLGLMTKAFGMTGFLVTIQGWLAPLVTGFSSLWTGVAIGAKTAGGALTAAFSSPVVLLAGLLASAAGLQRLLYGDWSFGLVPLQQLAQAIKDAWELGKSMVSFFYDVAKVQLTIALEGIGNAVTLMAEAFKEAFPFVTALATKLGAMASALLFLAGAKDSRGRPLLQTLMNPANRAAEDFAYDMLGGVNALQNPKSLPVVPKSKLSQGNTGLSITFEAAQAGLAEFNKKFPPAPKPIPTPQRILDLADQMFGRTAIKGAEDMMRALGGVGNVTKLTEERQLDLNKALMLARDAYKALGKEVPAEVQKILDATVKSAVLPKLLKEAGVQGLILEKEFTKQQIEAANNVLAARMAAMTSASEAAVRLNDEWAMSEMTTVDKLIFQADRWEESALKSIEPLKMMGKDLTSAWYLAQTAVAQIHSKMLMDAKGSAQKQVNVWAQIWQSLPSTIMGALQGGGNVGKSITSMIGNTLIGEGGQGALGQMLLGQMGSKTFKLLGEKMFNGIASIIPGLGPIIGQGLQLLGKGLAKLFGMGSAGRDAIREFEKSMGGSDELLRKLEVLGEEGARLWVNLTQKVGRDDKKAAEAASKAITAAFEALAKAQENVSKKLGELPRLVEKFAGVVPSAMRPMIDSLLKSTKLTDEHRSLLEALNQEPSWEKVQEAAERYGLSLDSLGVKFNQLKSNDIFDQLFSDFTLFDEFGADAGAVFDAMSVKVNEALNRAKKFGLMVPEYMRPMLTAMLDAGKLTDEFGNTLLDLKGVTFSVSIESSLDKIAKVLQAIHDLLFRISGLANTMPNPADLFEEPRMPKLYDPETGEPTIGFDYGASSSSPFRAGEGTMEANFIIEGRTIAKGVVPFIPDAVRDFAVTRG